MSRVLDGAEIPAATQAFALLIERIAAIAAEDRLAPTVEVAADLIWASANAASLLHVTARLRKTAPPASAVLEQNPRERPGSIPNSETKGRSQ